MISQRVIGISIAVLLLFIVVAFMFHPSLPKKENLNLHQTKNEVLSEIKADKEYQKKVSNLASNQVDNTGDLSPNLPQKNDEDNKKAVIQYFLTGLLTNKVDIFLSSFYPQTISDDLFKSKNPDKTIVTQEIIKRITKNGKLVDVQYQSDTTSNKITLNLIYKDTSEAKVTLTVILLGDKHHLDDKVYLVNTSAWDIIKQIEKGP